MRDPNRPDRMRGDGRPSQNALPLKILRRPQPPEAGAGYGPSPRRAWLPADVPLPERILLIETTAEGLGLTAASYHAPPGVNWKIAKARQAVASSTLATATGHVLARPAQSGYGPGWERAVPVPSRVA